MLLLGILKSPPLLATGLGGSSKTLYCRPAAGDSTLFITNLQYEEQYSLSNDRNC